MPKNKLPSKWFVIIELGGVNYILHAKKDETPETKLLTTGSDLASATWQANGWTN